MGLSSAMNTILIILMVFVVLVSVINFRKINIVNKKVNRVKRRYDALFRAQDGDIEDILNQNSQISWQIKKESKNCPKHWNLWKLYKQYHFKKSVLLTTMHLSI